MENSSHRLNSKDFQTLRLSFYIYPVVLPKLVCIIWGWVWGNCFAKNKLPGCFKLRED